MLIERKLKVIQNSLHKGLKVLKILNSKLQGQLEEFTKNRRESQNILHNRKNSIDIEALKFTRNPGIDTNSSSMRDQYVDNRMIDSPLF